MNNNSLQSVSCAPSAKKRGRRPKNHNIELTPSHPITRSLKQKKNETDTSVKQSVVLDDNLIIHLPVSSNDISDMIEFNINKGTPALPPKPYDTENNYAYIEGLSNTPNSKLPNRKHKYLNNEINLINTNIEFYDNNSKEKLPDKTNQHCLWCSCGFNTRPVALPISRINNKFYVRGCFCSFNCAMAYNFDKKFYNKWEYSALLHFLYKTIHQKYVKIIPAPSKELLKMYGGHLTIEEFRENFLTNDTSSNILFPPVISILPVIEEINNTDEMKDALYTPLDLDLLDNTSLSIKSKIVTPANVNNVQLTLKSYMDLSIIEN